MTVTFAAILVPQMAVLALLASVASAVLGMTRVSVAALALTLISTVTVTFMASGSDNGAIAGTTEFTDVSPTSAVIAVKAD